GVPVVPAPSIANAIVEQRFALLDAAIDVRPGKDGPSLLEREQGIGRWLHPAERLGVPGPALERRIHPDRQYARRELIERPDQPARIATGAPHQPAKTPRGALAELRPAQDREDGQRSRPGALLLSYSEGPAAVRTLAID